ncbi:GNAT family N-acetyltransferase [Acinetobacter nosocomialis]|uniref:GNAT family N-acetyltransferase n=1 Tax=Acinetobacter nosocomialis TaxID=106654 RepID=UPI0027099147|nr:GNAT family N-acetyltransferase [Acinetobacter nosocomialis]MDO7195113.1 GNAT family N-acetyltransferase [Acinetobacter nosocomialis]
MTINLNQLEPQAVVDAFLKHPPLSFQVHSPSDFLPYFYTEFDLLTTLDTDLLKKIKALPGYPTWGKILHFKTCFIGTTVTEYSLLPNGLPLDSIADFLKNNDQKIKLGIIKDLPLDSPLLSDLENNYSQTFIQEAEKKGFLSVEGQALAYVPIDFSSREEYLSRLSKPRRKNFKRKLKSLNELNIEQLSTGDERFNDPEFRTYLYELYLAVYHQSEIHFDLLRPEFFSEILQDVHSGGKVFLYWADTTLVGYNICYEYKDNLVDKYIGLNYPLAKDYNLYFISWFVNLDYALTHNLKFYIAGWTDPEVKAQLGAKFTFTRHLVWIYSPALRFILKKLRPLFEADHQWHVKQETRS